MKNEGGGSAPPRGADECPATSPSLAGSSHIKIEPTGVINLRVVRRSPPPPPPPPPLLPLCPLPLVPQLPPPLHTHQLLSHQMLLHDPLAMPGPSTSQICGGVSAFAGPSRPVPHINLVPDLRAIPLSQRLQPNDEDTSGETENDSLDDTSSSSFGSESKSPNGTMMTGADHEMVSVRYIH